MIKYLYPLIDNPFSDIDINEGIKVLKTKQLTISNKNNNFEKDFTNTIKSKHSLMVNSGSSAGQTIFHAHIHLIPRRVGDLANPRGGVRGVIPNKQSY